MGGAGAAARRERAFRPKLALGCQTTGRQGIQIRLLVCSSVARHSCRSRCFGQSKPSLIGGVKVCRTVLERRPAPERRARNDGTAVWQPPNEKWQRAERQLSFSVTGMKSSFHSRDCRLMGAGIGRRANATGPRLIVVAVTFIRSKATGHTTSTLLCARRMVVGVLCRRLASLRAVSQSRERRRCAR